MLKSPKRVVYQVTDFPKARQWYCDILDAQPMFDAPIASVFKVGDGSLSVVKSERSLPDDDGRTSVYFEVDDIEAVFARLLEAGGTELSPIRELLRIRTAQVRDPFGNVIGLCSGATFDRSRTVENRPSESALTVALVRALAARDDRPEVRGGDHLAELFLDDGLRGTLGDASGRSRLIARVVSPALYGYLTGRTAHLDSLFQQAIQSGLPQVVLLGAGYDTRAHRLQGPSRHTRIFEVDAATTQGRKRDLLSNAGVARPENLVYVPVDFAKDELATALDAAGFDRTVQTLFLWEGVTYYLPEEAVDLSLRALSAHCPAGSRLCFDIMTASLESVYAGEPFRFWIPTANLPELLRERGFKLVELLEAEELGERYLTLTDGTRAAPPLPQFCVVLAERS
jgi:methyltransferase (TIGR00027 family)